VSDDNITIADGVIAGGAPRYLSNAPAGRSLLGSTRAGNGKQIEGYIGVCGRLPRLLRDVARGVKIPECGSSKDVKQARVRFAARL